MMFQESTFKMTYVEELSTKFLILPCVVGELNMITILPGENSNLKMVMSVQFTFYRIKGSDKPCRKTTLEICCYQFFPNIFSLLPFSIVIVTLKVRVF
jgi:hypothetical protein